MTFHKEMPAPRLCKVLNRGEPARPIARKTFLILRRFGEFWDSSATVLDTFQDSFFAEARAEALQRQYPAQSFGVFGLESFTESELTSKLTRTGEAG